MSTVSPNVANSNVTTLTAATLTVDPTVHAGGWIVSNLAATQTITLPAATGTGHTYNFFIAITKTGAMVFDAVGTDVLNGGVTLATDAAGEMFNAAVTNTKLSMNGTTTGGVVGTRLHFTDVITGVWVVSGHVISTGAEATPFAA